KFGWQSILILEEISPKDFTLLKTAVLLSGTGLKGVCTMEIPAGYEAVAQEEMMTAALPLSPEELCATVTSTARRALLGPWTVVLTTGMSAATLQSPPGRWKADNYSQFWGMTVEEGFKKRLGTFPPSQSLLNMREAPPLMSGLSGFMILWISRTVEHPGLFQPQKIYFQTGVVADRIAIQSKGEITDNLSAQNLISCDTRNQHGCNGGSIDGAWRYLKTHGIVSYACYPSFWNKHLGPAAENQCYVSSESGKNHTNGPCPNAYEKSNRLYRCASHYRVSSKETDIMEEIKNRGPVQAIMKVYEDFFLYKGGIYRHSQQAGSKWKTHSVKLLGWGALRDKNGQKQKFWIAANSWGKSWGENGYFRILRGQNECDIEKLILATSGQP
ncbi:hypothetical protein IHE44_0009642, partial [Lamprotornis superbus]